MSKNQLRFFIFFLFTGIGFAQPYTDIAHFNYQYFTSHYKDDSSLKGQTSQYALHLFLPKQFKNGNVFLLRINSELISSSVSQSGICAEVASISMPVGFQFSSKSKRWSTVVMGIPKIASDFENSPVSGDWQIGGLFLQNYKPGEKLKLKAGLYYNKEAFGNFFVPLIGLDWRASERWNFYGILPTNYKIEYAIAKNKWYTGLDFKSVTRSFNLSGADGYIRFDETLLKLFAECSVYKNILLSGQVGCSLGKNPLQYNSGTHDLSPANGIYTPQKNYAVFNLGISYRIRDDFGK